MKTKTEILKETYEYYSTPSRRGTTNISCEYITPSGKMCAVGRCLINPKSMPKNDIDNIWDSHKVDLRLKEDYRGHDVIFWQDLQDWHDAEANFLQSQISKQGQFNFDYLLTKYANQ